MKILNQDFTAKEIAEIVLKGIANELPIGGLLASVYSDWQNKVQYTNVCDILVKFEERLIKLESRIDENFISSKEYVSLLCCVKRTERTKCGEKDNICRIFDRLLSYKEQRVRLYFIP